MKEEAKEKDARKKNNWLASLKGVSPFVQVLRGEKMKKLREG